MNSAEGKTRESQASGTNLDDHPMNQGAVPQHPNSASGTSREMDYQVGKHINPRWVMA